MVRTMPFVIALLFGIFQSRAQAHLHPLATQDSLEVSDVLTTHLLFGETLRYVDVGSPFFVTDTLDNIIRLKHVGQELENPRSQHSNLTVMTDQGSYYSFALRFNRYASQTGFRVGRSGQQVEVYAEQKREAQERSMVLSRLCEELRKVEPNQKVRKQWSDEMDLRVSGIFYIQGKIALRLELKNDSHIDFDIDQVLFRAKLKKRFTKDYLYQERIIEPIQVCTDDLELEGKTESSITFLFDKFMPNEDEDLFVDIYEANGGRSITTYIPRRKLMNPKAL